MNQLYRARGRQSHAMTAMVAVLLCLLPVSHALAAELLGLYVGAGIGEARVEAATSGQFGAPFPSLSDFRENHSAYKFMVGARPISLVAAELAYVDFGHPRVTGLPGLTSVDVSMKGLTAFGMLYLPVPVVDIYLKAGLARLDSRLTVTACGVGLCQTARLTPTNTGFAAGAGLQLKLAAWAARLEYERFNAAGGNPSLVSAGLTWSFL
jgi:opacity protein-like surface antigen